MAFSFRTKKGKEVTVYNPSEKGKMYALDLKLGKDINHKKLSNTQKAYRSGYLKAQNDSAKAYKAREFKKNNPDYKNKAKHF